MDQMATPPPPCLDINIHLYRRVMQVFHKDPVGSDIYMKKYLRQDVHFNLSPAA